MMCSYDDDKHKNENLTFAVIFEKKLKPKCIMTVENIKVVSQRKLESGTITSGVPCFGFCVHLLKSNSVDKS